MSDVSPARVAAQRMIANACDLFSTADTKITIIVEYADGDRFEVCRGGSNNHRRSMRRELPARKGYREECRR